MMQFMRQAFVPTIRFSAEWLQPEAPDRSESSASLALPKSAIANLPSTGALVVEGTINGFPFRSALEDEGQERLSLRVNRALQAAARASEANRVTVEITRVGDEPECRIPADLGDTLATTPPAERQWNDITPLARREWILWISSAKQPITRQDRIAKACSMLAAGKRRPCCFGGLHWLVKDHPAAGPTWIDLPKSERVRQPRP